MTKLFYILPWHHLFKVKMFQNIYSLQFIIIFNAFLSPPTPLSFSPPPRWWWCGGVSRLPLILLHKYTLKVTVAPPSTYTQANKTL